MKKLSLYGMILYGIGGVFSLALGLYSLPPTKGMSGGPITGMTGNIVPTMSWVSLSLGAVLIFMIAVMRYLTSPKFVRWNATIMALFGIVMFLLAPTMTMQSSPFPSLAMGFLGAVMLASGIGINVIAKPIGRPRGCPECGARVVTWGKKSITYCTRCEWYFGAIPESTSIMVSGDPGVGKTMLILKIADLFQSRGKKCVFVCYDQSPSLTSGTIGDLRQSLSHIAEGNFPQNLIMVDAFSSTASLKSDEQYHTNGAYDLNEINLILADLVKTTGGSLAVIIDSANPLFLHRDSSSVLKFLDYCRAKFVGKGGVFIFSLTKGTLEDSVQRRLESIADAILEMQFADKQGLVRRFRLKKMRGREIYDEWVYFEILPKEGIVFQPVRKEALAA